jgi:peptidoglycan-associated lipoprotein
MGGNALRTIYLLLMAVALAGCPKTTAEVELDLAKKAIDDARRANANDCAKETFVAAEQALAEAQQLEKDGEGDKAKEKANQAKTLAEQALAASPKDCAEAKDEKDGEDDETTDASANRNLNLDQLLETVYFDYNDATIREESKAMLSKVAQALNGTPASKLEVEGHCDVRGSTEYNLHLGERRARSVQKYLVTQGVQPDRIDVISYGEERLVDVGGTEEAHQKNRRAELKKQ